QNTASGLTLSAKSVEFSGSSIALYSGVKIFGTGSSGSIALTAGSVQNEGTVSSTGALTLSSGVNLDISGAGTMSGATVTLTANSGAGTIGVNSTVNAGSLSVNGAAVSIGAAGQLLGTGSASDF